ncbi:Uncharacterized protein SCG7109_AB_00210 [Chlamydiales bacterium SCGC AG-110-M15]|nr:Uncharacterized protein SCG7109_AB_00210 [Chlamydiales bacterium SCGC AG-110-M15]
MLKSFPSLLPFSKFHKIVFVFLLLLCLFSSSSTFAEGLIFITHPDTKEDSLRVKDISLIFTGKMRFWGSGVKIVPCLTDSGKVKNSLVEDYIGMTPGRFNMYWKRIIFTGHGRPPKTFKTEKEIIFFVKDTPGALGVISSDNNVLNSGVSKLSIRSN